MALIPRIANRLLAATVAITTTFPTLAQGLDRAKDAADSFSADLKILIPVIATIALMIIGLLYSKRILGKDALWSWVVGIVIGGSAAQLVAVFWGT